MRKCPVTFFAKEDKLYWKCPNNMGYQSPKRIESTHCWKYNCPGRCVLKEDAICAYELCNKLKRKGSKYCNDQCRKRKARRDYDIRKKSLSSQT